MAQQKKWLSNEDVQRLKYNREGNPLLRALATRRRGEGLYPYTQPAR